MKYCIECGNRIPSEAKFCPSCGKFQSAKSEACATTTATNAAATPTSSAPTNPGPFATAIPSSLMEAGKLEVFKSQARRCTRCGSILQPETVNCPYCVDNGGSDFSTSRYGFEFTEIVSTQLAKSETNRSTYIIFGLLLGGLGVHNFVAGYTGRGVAQLLLFLMACFLSLVGIGWLLFAPLTIWVLIEVCTTTCDSDGQKFS